MLEELVQNSMFARNDESPWLLSYSDLITNLYVFFAFLLSMSVMSTYRFESLTNYFKKKPKYSLADLKKQIDSIIISNHLESKISTSIGQESLEIDFSHSLLFQSGESALLEEAKPHILTFVSELKTIDHKWAFIVEGHTDNVPIHTLKFPSNWELSAYRAMEFLNFLRFHGIDENRIQLRGFAHTRPKKLEEKAEVADAEEYRNINRRVTLKIY
ncbi:MAG: flagellar motor protein MotB [Deltaproteobacteria bacterium]|nr:flagellar motor protein MotB [Deltaproteobacteria bacterium]